MTQADKEAKVQKKNHLKLLTCEKVFNNESSTFELNAAI